MDSIKNVPSGQKIPLPSHMETQNTNEKLPSLRKLGAIHGFDIYVDLKGLEQMENAQAYLKVLGSLENFFNPLKEEVKSIWSKLKFWKR